jgi:hypothetical protein
VDGGIAVELVGGQKRCGGQGVAASGEDVSQGGG